MPNNFADRLRRFSQVAGLSQSDIARACQVTRAAVGAWWRGTGLPKPETLERLACVLGVTPAALAFGEEDHLVASGSEEGAVVSRLCELVKGLSLEKKRSVLEIVEGMTLMAREEIRRSRQQQQQQQQQQQPRSRLDQEDPE
jgi:transcriptional regulator with XRE-family HTH domain